MSMSNTATKIEEFDLNDKIFEISDGIPETLDISFHISFNDAENEENAIWVIICPKPNIC